MELRRDRSVTTRASDSTQQCGVGARDRKSPCGHVVCSPSSEQLEVGHSLSHVTNNSRDDDVIAGQPISVGREKEPPKAIEGEVKKTVCVRHPDRCLVLYCRDCSQATCEMCFIQQHNGHCYASIEDVIDQLRSQYDALLERVQTRMSAVSEKLDTVEDYRTQLTANLQEVKTAMTESLEQLRSQVEAEAEALKQLLTADSGEVLRILESMNSKLRRHFDALNELTTRCLDSRQTSVATELAADLPDLLASVNRLEQQPIDVTEYQPTYFRFTESSYRKYLPDERMNLIGRIDVGPAETADTAPTWTQLYRRVSELEAEMTQRASESRDMAARLQRELSQATKRESELTKQLQAVVLKLKRTERLLIKPVRVASIHGPRSGALACNAGVRGLVQLDSHLYVLQVGRASTDIAVHRMSLSAKRLSTVVRRLTVPGLNDASDLAACGRHHCLYVADVGSDCVHRLNGLESTINFQSWPVGDKPWGLSVTSAGTIWVSCFVRQKLKEFTGYGQTLRVVSLHPDISYPWHATEFGGGGRILVCHGGVGAESRRVIAVGMDGRGSSVFGLEKCSTPTAAPGLVCGGGHSNSPLHAAVDADNFITVVDCENRAITVLDSDLSFVRNLVSANESAGLGLKDTRRVCLDAANNRMYVGDGNGSVTVLQLNS